MINLEVPNKDYIELTFVKETATGKGLNTQFIMENTKDGFFKIIDGRVGIKVGPHKPKVYKRPIEDWNTVFRSKTTRGYLVTKTQKTKQVVVEKHSKYKEIPDKITKEIVERLMCYANQYMEENFTVKVDDISDEMVKLGSEIISELQTNFSKMSVAEFNTKLKVLYAAIPRRIDNLSEKLARSKSNFVKIIEDEQEIFDFMLKQVRAEKEQEMPDETILDMYGLEIRAVTENEEKQIKEKLSKQASKYQNAWKVSLKSSEDKFKRFCNKENITEENGGISYLFHGSKHPLWWSILTNGIWCEPEKHPEFHGNITGKAGGLGAYFAPNAIKAMGYTSFLGSKWAKGTEKTGFLALFKVATGNQYYGQNGYGSHFTWNVLQNTSPGSHCLWLKKEYSGFMMDEVIIYREEQFTIDYLIEIG